MNGKVLKTLAHLTDLYISDSKHGNVNTACLLTICFFYSLTLSTLLFFALFVVLKYSIIVSLVVPSAVAVILSGILFSSKTARCISVLFFLFFGIHKSKDIYLKFGNAVVIFWTVTNILNNLKALADTLMCNLEVQKNFINVSLIAKYEGLIKWIFQAWKASVEIGIMVVNVDMKGKVTISSNSWTEKFDASKDRLKIFAQNALFVLEMISNIANISQKMFFALSSLLVLIHLTMYLRKYLNNKEFENIYITKRFMDFDEKVKAAGKPHVLPLTEKEKKTYITINFSSLSIKSVKTMKKFFIPVFIDITTWLSLMGVDYFLYWLILRTNVYFRTFSPVDVPLWSPVKICYPSSTFTQSVLCSASQ
ncbi:dendritic cell-specific transmembrane protein isoform X2 [Polypterus senegalus]|uniref:dendritic cell-specific transmembrane protein isoform X2 n=1 Tax=Polypterus senegalus TaxID=55291 RepID=UPI00196297B1|nr:dendritic cell-specific transmembrane protein isoform X2 [Polypterus senegalus]